MKNAFSIYLKEFQNTDDKEELLKALFLKLFAERNLND